MGVPVQVLGVVRQPGSILRGDEDGLTVVPLGAFSGPPRVVERIHSGERKLMGFIRRADLKVGELHGRFLE
jgi:regulator of RNase E activity RraA